MPIRQFTGNRAFSPEDLEALNRALSGAVQKLALSDLKDPLTEIVARRIIDPALAGERDPIKLTEIGAGGRD
jgi:hypothetical protein